MKFLKHAKFNFAKAANVNSELDYFYNKKMERVESLSQLPYCEDFQVKLYNGKTYLVNQLGQHIDGLEELDIITLSNNCYVSSVKATLSHLQLCHKFLNLLQGLIYDQEYNFFRRASFEDDYSKISWFKLNGFNNDNHSYYDIVTLENDHFVGETDALLFQPLFKDLVFYTMLDKSKLAKFKQLLVQYIDWLSNLDLDFIEENVCESEVHMCEIFFKSYDVDHQQLHSIVSKL